MKKALLGALIGLVVIVNCAGDIYVAPASPIYGAYIGEYKVVRQTDTGTKTKRAEVEWTFSDKYQWVKILQDNPDEGFCGSDGPYEISSIISLKVENIEQTTCDLRDLPMDDFSFQRLTTAEGRDSLYLIQVVPGDTGWTKEAFLLKDTTTATPQ